MTYPTIKTRKLVMLALCGLALATCGALHAADPAGTWLVADGSKDAYAHINKVLGGTAYEVPDCAHKSFGPHIIEAMDEQLGRPVFCFFLHATPDNDRCEKFDRQRNEIKTYGPSPAALKAFEKDTVTYKWKFKLDAAFQPSDSFTHIHQIKAGDGDDGMPLITLSPRFKSGNKHTMEVIHIDSKGASTKLVTTAPLAPFLGHWVDVTETISYGKAGKYVITITDLASGATLLNYATPEGDTIDMWRKGTTFCRPKWGIYRSLAKAETYLRDEEVRFTDIGIIKQ